MNSTNWLARIFDWFGDVFERFNPSAFRFLAATLPYLTPVPVAWLTAKSSGEFLQFSPQVSFIFVFCLEGMGLWFTTLLVDAVVDWIRSRNIKTFSLIIMFGLAVTAYIFILVNLNVTLEEAAGNISPALSRVITLMCFLPLLTGIGNGYYKLKLDMKTETQSAKVHQEELQDKIRREQNEYKIRKTMVKSGMNPFAEQPAQVYTKTVQSTKARALKPTSFYKDRMLQYMTEQYSITHRVPTIAEVVNKFGLEYRSSSGYIHGLRKSWAKDKGVTLE